MKKFELFNKFNDAVIVINNKLEVVYKNNIFNRIFSDFVDIKKFSHQLNFDVCTLDSENMNEYSPIYQAIFSPQDFFAAVSYQNEKRVVKYFNLNTLKRTNYIIVIFTDVTAIHNCEALENKYNKLSETHKKLKNETENLAKIREQAQSQAIKMALINKISNSIRESIDLSQIIHSALKEISTMFGAFKVYYASPFENSYKIQQITNEFKSEKGSVVDFDEATKKKISKNTIIATTCMKENINSENFASAFRIIVPIYYANAPLGIVVILSHKQKELTEELDILESVSTQLANAIIQASLYEQVNKKNDELQIALKDLKDTQVQLINSEKMASLGQLIAGVAHEINTPLASINSNNSIAAKLIKKVENSDLSETFSDINTLDKEAITRISNIVKSLKKFVRLDEADVQEADINKELDLTLDLMRHETKNKVEIIKNYSQLPPVKCYPNMLNQVFMNILMNACQSIEEKGVITITTSFKDNILTVKIKDTGKGIAKKDLDNIFTAGYTTKGVGVGTGLGLAISQKIIQKHSGKIKVSSSEGEGSKFIITIPSE